MISGTITENGRSEIENPPAGRARVSAQTFKPQPRPEPGVNPATGIDYSLGWEDTGPCVPIPTRYHSVKISGLETTIEPGEQTFDISLTRSWQIAAAVRAEAGLARTCGFRSSP